MDNLKERFLGSEFEYDSLYELCSYMEYKEKQYKVRAFIDYVDGDSLKCLLLKLDKN